MNVLRNTPIKSRSSKNKCKSFFLSLSHVDTFGYAHVALNTKTIFSEVNLALCMQKENPEKEKKAARKFVRNANRCGFISIRNKRNIKTNKEYFTFIV